MKPSQFWTAGQTSLEQCKLWLDDCVHKHKHAEPVHTPRAELQGFCLIDVDSRKIVPTSVKAQYIALSYVWGSDPHPQVFVGDALADSLPQTLEDAMYLTKALGIKYLWIDAIRIPQNGTIEDFITKAKQIEAMDIIYECALATIVACSPNANHGLYSICQPNWTARSICKSGLIIEYQPLPWSSLVSYHGQVNPAFSPWSTRGWTFQESLVSRRRIMFLEDRVIFECDDNSRQTHPTDCHEQIKCGFFNDLQRISSEPMRQWNMHWYQCLLNLYLKRNLTYEDDIVNAFLGASSQIAKRGGNRGLCLAIPKTSFLSALMWAPVQHSTGVRKRKRKSEEKYRPSWHWSSLVMKDGIAFCQGSEPLQMYQRAEKDFTTKWDYQMWSNLKSTGILDFRGYIVDFGQEENIAVATSTRHEATAAWVARQGTFITCDAWFYAATVAEVSEPLNIYPYATRLGHSDPMKENRVFVLLIRQETEEEVRLRRYSASGMSSSSSITSIKPTSRHQESKELEKNKTWRRAGWAVLDIEEWEKQAPKRWVGWLS